MFDAITIQQLKGYVYALINPINGKPFYVGKGNGNRVFAHRDAVKNGDQAEIGTLKDIEIAQIFEKQLDVEHIIVRHGLSDDEAFMVESVLIDFWRYFKAPLTNEVLGHLSGLYGIKTADEIIRQYNAPPLEKLYHHVAIININKKYSKIAKSNGTYLNAVKEAWVISAENRKKTQYVLAEYQGIIVGVYAIQGEWYPVETSENKRNHRWGFHGIEAPPEIIEIYKNKSIMHVKKRGAAFPIRYKL